MRVFSISFINRTVQILLVFLFVVNVSTSFYAPLLSVYITQNIVGATLGLVGVGIALYSITKSCIQIPLAKFLDKQAGEKIDFFVLLTGALLGSMYSFGLLFVAQMPHLYMLQMLSGVADAFLMAAYYAIFAHHIDKESQGFEWSLLSVGGLTASTAVGGAIGGIIAGEFGFRTIFIFAGTLNALSIVLLVAVYPYIKVFRQKRHYKTIKSQK